MIVHFVDAITESVLRAGRCEQVPMRGDVVWLQNVSYRVVDRCVGYPEGGVVEEVWTIAVNRVPSEAEGQALVARGKVPAEALVDPAWRGLARERPATLVAELESVLSRFVELARYRREREGTAHAQDFREAEAVMRRLIAHATAENGDPLPRWFVVWKYGQCTDGSCSSGMRECRTPEEAEAEYDEQHHQCVVNGGDVTIIEGRLYNRKAADARANHG